MGKQPGQEAVNVTLKVLYHEQYLSPIYGGPTADHENRGPETPVGLKRQSQLNTAALFTVIETLQDGTSEVDGT